MARRRTDRKRPEPKRGTIGRGGAARGCGANPAPAGNGPFDGKDRLRLLYENARIGMAIAQLDGTFLSANPAACRILGYREEEIAGRTFASITHPDDVEVSLDQFRKLVAGECESYDLIKRYIHKDGRPVDALITVSLVRDEGGRPLYVLAQVEDLSRQRRITKDLRETEIHYRSLFDNMLNGLAYCRMIYEEGRPVDFVYLDVNQAFEKHTGLQGVVGRKVTEVIPGIRESNPEIFEIYGRVARTGVPEAFEGYVEPLDMWFSISVYCPRSEHFTAVFDVVTERKRAEQALELSEEKYRTVFENAAEGIVIAKDGMIVMANPATARVTGRSEEELLSTPFIEFIHPDDRALVFRHHVARLEGRDAPGSYEFRLLNRDRTVRWVEIRPVLIPWEGARATLNFLTDVTERREAGRVLAESEETYRSIFSSANDAETGAILDANGMAVQVLGYTVEELRRLQVADFTPVAPGYTQEDAGRLVRAAAGGEAQLFEWPLRSKEGRVFWAEVNLKRATIRGRARVLALARDITARKRAEEERARLETAFEQAAETVVITDADGTILYVNPAFTKISGYTREEAIGRNPRVLKSGEHDPAFYKRLWETIRGGETWQGRFRNKKKDGTTYMEDATISPVRDQAGAIVNFVAVKRDVTDLVRLEADLRQAQKMEAIGTLAGGIAHDFNNILYSILGFTDLAMDSVPRETRTHRCLQGIREAGARGTDLVAQILAFSRRKERERQPVLLQEVVPQTLRLLAGTAPSSVNIRQMLDPACGPVLGDRTEFQQIVMNLCSNAFHAMREKGGDLDIRLEEVRLDGANVPASGLPRGGRYARLSVGDTGHGIDDSTARRMFEPYFTTKPVGEGTGLGLSTVLGIVQAMEGSVRAESAPGRGARFDVLLPVHEPTNGTPAPAANANELENSPPTEVEHAADSRGR